jgi:tRNA threonylcarbamoyladenosine biosynthesis protein TsaB
LPVLPVSSLRALAAQAQRCVMEVEGMLPQGALLACMDARMGEVYWGLFNASLDDAAEQVGAPGALQVAGFPAVAAAAGKGMSAWPDIAVSLQLAPLRVFADAEPHARDVALLAVSDLSRGAHWLDAALAQPVYLRDQVVQAAKKA